jgi:iron(III) transport system substrate-binding protein
VSPAPRGGACAAAKKRQGDSKMKALLFGIVAAVAVAVSPAAIAAADLPPAVQKLIEPAKAERTFRITWGGSTLSGAEGARRFEQGFNKHYGLSIKFDFTPGLSFPAMANKLGEEFAAGHKALTDLALAGIGQTSFYTARNILIPVDWAELVPHIDPGVLKTMVSPESSLISFVGRATTIVYNTNFVKREQAPKRLTDLLDPKWKGRIASTSYAAGFGPLAGHPDWSSEKVIEFAKQLSGNLGGLIRCGEYERITSGEFWIFAIECEPGIVRLAIERGAPMGQNIPLDMLQVDHWWFGVPKHAQSPNIAKLFIAWILTKDGQAVLLKNQGEDLNYLEGSYSAKLLEAASKEAGKPIDDMNIHKLLAQKGRDDVVNAVIKIFREAKK